MQTMRAAVLYDVRDLRVVDVPMPEAGDDGVLIRVNTVGICGTDLHTYKLGMFREMSLPQAEGALSLVQIFRIYINLRRNGEANYMIILFSLKLIHR